MIWLPVTSDSTIGQEPSLVQGKWFDLVTRWVLVTLAGIAAGGALWRMTYGKDPSVLLAFDLTTLAYVGVAAALLLFRDVKSLAFGDYKVEFERTQRLIANTRTVAADALAAAVGQGGRRPAGPSLCRVDVQPGPNRGDPWKNQFGGSTERSGRTLEARVRHGAGTPDLFDVTLRVVPTNEGSDPLRGAVQFFLHPTFRNDRPMVTVSPAGIAELSLLAYGAFTVGAIADNGNTVLELDLAELPHAPEEFKRG